LPGSLSLPQRQTRILGSIVQSLVWTTIDLTPGSTMGSQIVSDGTLWRTSLFLQFSDQQAPRSLSVAMGLYNFFQHMTILINHAPQPAFLVTDASNDFIEMPDIAGRGHLAAQSRREQRTMRPTPSADRFVRNWYTALKHHFFNFTQTEIEAEIQPDYTNRD